MRKKEKRSKKREREREKKKIEMRRNKRRKVIRKNVGDERRSDERIDGDIGEKIVECIWKGRERGERSDRNGDEWIGRSI